jgi:hypothetical protein
MNLRLLLCSTNSPIIIITTISTKILLCIYTRSYFDDKTVGEISIEGIQFIIYVIYYRGPDPGNNILYPISSNQYILQYFILEKQYYIAIYCNILSQYILSNIAIYCNTIYCFQGLSRPNLTSSLLLFQNQSAAAKKEGDIIHQLRAEHLLHKLP